MVQSRGSDFSDNTCDLLVSYPWKQLIQKLEAGWKAGLLLGLRATATRLFWCLKSTFIFSLSTSESQVNLLTMMLGYFSLFLFSTCILIGSQLPGESLSEALTGDLGLTPGCISRVCPGGKFLVRTVV